MIILLFSIIVYLEINQIQLQNNSTSNGEKIDAHENDKRSAVLLIELNSNLNEVFILIFFLN
jgi:hypothetical protein